jgi:dipeptidyl aminopeptidase/acylaminoacyl peptidase
MKRIFLLLGGFLLIPVFTWAQNLDTLQLKTIFFQPYLAGVRPDFSFISPVGRTVYFQWNDSSYTKKGLYKVDIKGKYVKEAPKETIKNGEVSPDQKYIAYINKNDLWIADANGKNRHTLITSPDKENNIVWSPDSKRIAFTKKGNVWITNIDKPEIKQITNNDTTKPGYSIDAWADNGHELILQQYDSSKLKKYYFPEYVHKYVNPGEVRRGISTVILSVVHLDTTNKIQQLAKGRFYIRNIDVNKSGRYLAIDKIDAPMKHRDIIVYDLKNDTSKVVFRDSTKGWITWDITEMEFAPTGNQLMFTSEQSGWNHIYTVNPDGSGLKQQTHGNYEIPWAAWLNNHEFVYASTKVSPGERHIYTLSLKNNEIKGLTPSTAFRLKFHLSHDRRYLVYQKTYWNQPNDLYALDLKHPRKEIQLTHTVPDRFKKLDWETPVYRRFTSRDGHTKISMTILKPRHFQQGKKYPVIVFVHGAGSLQDVFKGWSENYHREHMFNQYLADHGYAVINVDYRHSTGYGRKFREDVVDWLGRYETEDIIDGLNELSKDGYADLNKVGIYGGSYGGFMSLYAVSTAPEHFEAAAALRAVTNWRNYYYTNPWYTLPRLGTPEKNPENYRRSSPITYADSLKRPVLILHGLRDNNVGFQDAAEYIHKLIESGHHNFKFMMYPTERHGFKKDYDWYDEYSRIYRFMNKQLN